MPERTCRRCGIDLEQPLTETAVYVSADEFASERPVEVVHAYVHTDATQDAVAALQDGHYPDVSEGVIEDAISSRGSVVSYLGPPESGSGEDVSSLAPALAAFERVTVADVADAPPETVAIEHGVETRTTAGSALVCPDCLRDSDTLIWGDA